MGKRKWIVRLMSFIVLIVIFMSGIAIYGMKKNTIDNQNLKLIKMRVGYHPNFGGASLASIGVDKGFFREEGLDVQLVQFTSGPPSVAALQAGDVDVSFLGHGAYGLVIEGQADVIAVDCLSNAEEIIVHTDSEIRSMEDLNGKTLATQFDTSGENFLDTALCYYQLDRSQIKLVNMDVAGCVSAFYHKNVDAVSVWAPYTGEIRNMLGTDQVRTIVNCMDFRDTFALPMSWVSTREYIGTHEDAIIRFLKALYRCMDYRNENLDETVKLVADRLSMEPDVIAQDKETGVWLTSKETGKLIEDGTIMKWYGDQRQFFIEKHAINYAMPLEEYMRLDLMSQSIHEGGCQ